MAILGVLLGITMTVLGWVVLQIRDHEKLIIDLQNKVIFDMGERVAALERRRAGFSEVATPVSAEVATPAPIRRRWSEDIPAKDSN